MLSHHRERRADSCKSLQSMNCVYISSHTHTYIFIHVCTHVCLHGCLWCQHMPRFIIPQSLRQHAEPGTMTCVEMRPIAPGWVDHWTMVQLRSKGLGHMAMAILQLLRYLQWNGEMDLPELVLCGQVAGLRFWGSFRELEWLAFDGLVESCRCFGTSVLGVEHVLFFLKYISDLNIINCTKRCLAEMIWEESWVIAWMRRSLTRRTAFLTYPTATPSWWPIRTPPLSN